MPFMETWYYVPETRWMSRGKILFMFRKGFPAIMKFLQGRGIYLHNLKILNDCQIWLSS